MEDYQKAFAYSREKMGDPEFLKKTKRLEEIYASLPKTTCQHQGNCCQSFFHTSVEYHRYMDYIDKHTDDETKKKMVDKLLNFEDRAVYVASELTEYRCLFRNLETKKCDIYPVRGYICRAYGLLPNGCEFVESLEEKELTPEGNYKIVKELESLSEHLPIDPPLPLTLPMEIWIRIAIYGIKEAMTYYFSSNHYKLLKKMTQTK